MPQYALKLQGSNWEELEKKLSFKGSIKKLFEKAKVKFTKWEAEKIFFTDPGNKVGKTITMTGFVFMDPEKVGNWQPICYVHLKNMRPKTTEKITIMPCGKVMNSTDLPGGRKIKAGEKFDIIEAIRIKNDYGSGPFLLLGIEYKKKRYRQNFKFFRFVDYNGKEKYINKEYCF